MDQETQEMEFGAPVDQQDEAMEEAEASQIAAVERAMKSVAKAAKSVEEAAGLVYTRQAQSEDGIGHLNGRRLEPEKSPAAHHFSALKELLDEMEERAVSFIQTGREHLAHAAEALARHLEEDRDPDGEDGGESR